MLCPKIPADKEITSSFFNQEKGNAVARWDMMVGLERLSRTTRKGDLPSKAFLGPVWAHWASVLIGPFMGFTGRTLNCIKYSTQDNNFRLFF